LRAALDNLLPVLAAGEPSKAPFYIAGAVLAAWAVALGFAGINRPQLPGSTGAARAIMGVSALLVLVTVGTAVGTATKHHGEAHAEGGGAGQGHAAPEAGTQRGHEPEPAATAKPQESAASGTGGATVEISADPSGQLKYEQTSVTARPGKVRIEFDNPSPVPHDVTVAEGSKKLGGTKVVSEAKATTEVVLQPGSYTFYCSVDGHRQAGMRGTLAVQP
jgi:plastocyanin